MVIDEETPDSDFEDRDERHQSPLKIQLQLPLILYR